MSKKTHTPGPWRVRVLSGEDFIIETAEGVVLELASVHRSAEYEANLPVLENARVMAAGPEMLAALGKAAALDPFKVESTHTIADVRDAARDILAKVKEEE